jgi:hypothetical protein
MKDGTEEWIQKDVRIGISQTQSILSTPKAKWLTYLKKTGK